MGNDNICVSKFGLLETLDKVWDLLAESGMHSLQLHDKIINSEMSNKDMNSSFESLKNMKDNTREALNLILILRKAAMDKESY